MSLRLSDAQAQSLERALTETLVSTPAVDRLLTLWLFLGPGDALVGDVKRAVLAVQDEAFEAALSVERTRVKAAIFAVQRHSIAEDDQHNLVKSDDPNPWLWGHDVYDVVDPPPSRTYRKRLARLYSRW